MREILCAACRILLCVSITMSPAQLSQLLACANEYEHGKPKTVDPKWQKQQDAREYVEGLLHERNDLQTDLANKKQLAERGDYRDQSNYAVALIRTNRLAPALEILEKLASEHPEEYTILANLGTVYELTGDVPNALKWIRKANQLNPESHAGTEWLHVKILEAKLKYQADADWFNTHTVLGLDFGNSAQPQEPRQLIVDEQQRELSLDDVRKGLEYQLHERMALIKGDDPIVGDLLLSLGNILVLQNQPEHAFGIFTLASDYYSEISPLLISKIKFYNEIPKTDESVVNYVWQTVKDYVLQITLALLLIIAIFVYILKKRTVAKNLNA